MVTEDLYNDNMIATLVRRSLREVRTGSSAIQELTLEQVESIKMALAQEDACAMSHP